MNDKINHSVKVKFAVYEELEFSDNTKQLIKDAVITALGTEMSGCGRVITSYECTVDDEV